MSATAKQTRDDALRQLLVEALRRRDGWIPVEANVASAVDTGATLDDVVSEVVSRPAQLPFDPDTELTSSEHLHYALSVLGTIDVFDATSETYPPRLRRVSGRPLLLFIRGARKAISATPIAIVGSREASPDGRRAAFDVAAALASAGHTIVSGLAEGIDTAAHEGALAVGGDTVAVVGTGIDKVFPPSNADLSKRIEAHGMVLSQFAPGQGPSKTTFPARNAVIAGLSAASLLVELKERSGTRIEADRTLEQGKPVLLWGPIMRHQRWAHEFAKHDQVEFVDSAAEIDSVLSRSAAL